MTVKKVNDAAPSKSYTIFIDQMNGFIQKAKPMSVYGGKRNVYPCMIEYISDTSICFSAEVLKEEFYLKKLKFSHYLGGGNNIDRFLSEDQLIGNRYFKSPTNR